MTDAKNRGPPKDEWRTPPQLVKDLEWYFKTKFTLDPCSAPDNHLGIEAFYTEREDGLCRDWRGIAFVNPPYSNKWEWVSKAFLEMCKRNVESFVLLENLVEGNQFHSWAQVCDTYLLKGRIRFLNAELKPEGQGFRGSMILRFKRGYQGGIYPLNLESELLLQDRSPGIGEVMA